MNKEKQKTQKYVDEIRILCHLKYDNVEKYINSRLLNYNIELDKDYNITRIYIMNILKTGRKDICNYIDLNQELEKIVGKKREEVISKMGKTIDITIYFRIRIKCKYTYASMLIEYMDDIPDNDFIIECIEEIAKTNGVDKTCVDIIDYETYRKYEDL